MRDRCSGTFFSRRNGLTTRLQYLAASAWPLGVADAALDEALGGA